MRFLEALVIVVLIGALLAVVVISGQREPALSAQIGSLQQADARQARADIAAAGAHETECAAQVAGAVKAGIAIARLSTPRARSAPNVQPMYSAAEIRGAMQ